jgi:hypothetical protein
MKKLSFNIMGLVIALFTMSVVLVSCADDYGNAVNAPQPSEKTDHTTQPEKPDSTKWKNYAGTTHKVYPESYVITKMYGLNYKGKKDSLVNRYPFVRSLKNDTTLYLKEAPEGGVSYSTSPESTWLGEFTFNAQNDSCAVVYGRKGYKLSNGVTLTLNTERMTYYHMIDGKAWKYSEPTQKFGSMSINSSVSEFERNDSIFGLRTNVCKTYTQLGTETFVDSCTVKEIWFKALKEKPEPSYNVVLNEYAKFICGSKVKVSKNNWKDAFLFVGAKQIHVVVANLDNNGGRALSYEVKSIDKSRVVYNAQVNGVIYDSQTGSYIPALITPDNKDKNGWFTDGEIDGRSVTYDPTNAQAVEEGIKNFVGKDTSVPTPFFVGNPSTSNTNWKEYTYTSVTWSKYSKDTDMVTQTMTVKMPTK